MNTPSPVRLVRVEVDGVQRDVAGREPGVRYWIEVTRRGQIVGVLERTADQAGTLGITVKELADQFADVEISDFTDFPMSRLPKASVVVPTMYRRVDLLQQTIQSLLNLEYPDYEIIVVDNRVGPGHTPIPAFSDDLRVKIVAEGTPGVSAARNRGFAESQGDFVAFTDDDVEVDRQWLRALGVAFARNAGIDAIGGMVRPFELETEPQLWFEEFYGGFTKSLQATQRSLKLVGRSDPMFPYSPGHFGAGCNMAVRRTAFERSNGFDVHLGGGTVANSGEDLKLFLDIVFAGGTVAYVPSAVVRHTHRRTEKQFMEQIFSYGVGLTALFTDLIFDDPRHLFKILKRVPRGMWLLLHPKVPRSPSTANSYPRRTQSIHLLGMAYGPLAYGLSVAKVRLSRRR
jgi:glycosyltransferase involved in cell wall biosynthesis